MAASGGEVFWVGSGYTEAHGLSENPTTLLMTILVGLNLWKLSIFGDP